MTQGKAACRLTAALLPPVTSPLCLNHRCFLCRQLISPVLWGPRQMQCGSCGCVGTEGQNL